MLTRPEKCGKIWRPECCKKATVASSDHIQYGDYYQKDNYQLKEKGLSPFPYTG